MMASHLHFIVTGGTFDGALKEIGAVPKSTVIGSYLEQAIRPCFSYSLEVPFLKDSRDINESDRRQIGDLIRRTEHTRIVITHGTYTLVQTAKELDAMFPGAGKTIVVTGAMTPFSEPCSDAAFNLGFACSAALFGPAGTWVAMRGQLWRPEDVTKNLESNQFEDASS